MAQEHSPAPECEPVHTAPHKGSVSGDVVCSLQGIGLPEAGEIRDENPMFRERLDDAQQSVMIAAESVHHEDGRALCGAVHRGEVPEPSKAAVHPDCPYISGAGERHHLS